MVEYFTELSEQVSEWSLKNFGKQIPDRPLIGVVEEVGELIEHLHEANQEKIIDSVGDIMVYLADFSGRLGLKISTSLKTPDVEPDQLSKLDLKEAIFILVGRMCHSYLKMVQSIRVNENHMANLEANIVNLIGKLWTLSHYQGFQLDEAVNTTWDEVKQRNWKNNPVNGV